MFLALGETEICNIVSDLKYILHPMRPHFFRIVSHIITINDSSVKHSTFVFGQLLLSERVCNKADELCKTIVVYVEKLVP